MSAALDMQRPASALDAARSLWAPGSGSAPAEVDDYIRAATASLLLDRAEDVTDEKLNTEHQGVLLAELQAQWASPAQAVGWLQAQLFSAPGPDRPGLPAYRDLLTLFIVARDLHRQADGLETDVDLLLPLADGDERVATQRTSIFDRLEPGGGAPTADSAVDVNLNEPAARS